MSQLVAQLKADSSDAQVADNAPAQPSPMPRHRRYQACPSPAWACSPWAACAATAMACRPCSPPMLASVPQYEVAANATLTNGQFDVANGGLNAAQGWASEGSVAIASGTALLSESATRQTRLNQVFMLGAQDRYLSFTLSGVALDDQANGPDDAFEVARIGRGAGALILRPVTCLSAART